jgi:hypothetical protein
MRLSESGRLATGGSRAPKPSTANGQLPSYLYPWRCLCFGFEQMTITTLFRRTILHFSQRVLTDARTFIAMMPS